MIFVRSDGKLLSACCYIVYEESRLHLVYKRVG
jgi:hypothetical protein